MADSPQTSEELPIAGKWWRDELKGCESTQVMEPSRRYIAWLDRVQQDFGSLWKDFGIFDFIQLSRLGLKYQQEMIIAALHFFESSTNTFQFECGMMTPTFFDVAAITSFPPTGDTYDPTLAGSKIEPNIRAKSYTRYIEEQNHFKGEVSDEEHVAFLVLWLSQHVFCTRSLQVAKMFLPMAIQLHEGQQFGFGNVCENIKQTGDGSTFLGSGPFWLLQLWLNATFRVEMDLFLPDLHNEEVAKRQIEGVRLGRLIPRTRGLTYQQLFLQYFEAFLGLKEFKERFAPFVDRQVGPSWFIHLFPPLPEFEEYQNAVWSAFLTPTVISCRFGLKSTEFGLVGYFPNFVSRQFGLTQLLPKTIYLHERDICLGYYGMTEPQFYAFLKKFEGLEYELTPFHFELSHAHTVDFSRWWNLHYESQMVDVVVLRSAIEAGFNAQAIRKIKSTLNARGSRSKVESNSLAKPHFPPVKTEPGATTRKRAATAEVGGPSKKARPEEIVLIDDDVVVEVEEKQSTPAPKASNENPQPESELRRKRKHEQPKPILEETHTTPSEKEEKKEKKKKKKKDKDAKGKKSPLKDGVPTGNVSIPEQASPAESKNQETSVDPDSTPRTTSASHNPKNTDLGQGEPSSTVLVPEISPDSIVKTVVDELKQQLEHTGEGELSPMTKAVEDTGIQTQDVVLNLNETSPPKTSTEVELTVEAESSKAGEIKDLDNSLRETLPTILEKTTPKKLNEINPEVVGTPSKTKELDSSGVKKEITENVDTQASKDDKLVGDITRTQVNPPVEETITAQTNPDPPLTKGPMMESSRPSGEDNAEVTKVAGNVEEEMSDKGEHSSTKDHHPSKSGNEQASKDDKLVGDITRTQVNPPVEETITAQTNHDPPLTKGPMMESSRPSGEDNAEVTKVAGNVEEEMSDKGEHSSTKDHHPSKSGNEDEGYEATDDFLNSSAGYARTARTGDSIDDDGTSVSKPTSDFFLPSHVLQSVKDLAPEEALDILLKTYGSEVPIARNSRTSEKSAVYFNLKSLFTTLQRLPIFEALSFQITQAENLLEQYARSLQHFNRLTIDLNKQIETRAKHFDLASQGNAEVNALKAASACEDNIARWKSEIRELECKIGQEEEKKKQLEAQAVEVPKTTIEEKAKTGIHHYCEALRAGVEMDRLVGEKNVVQRKLAHIKSLYDQFRQAHI
ncbi:hypothetical protein TSUD_239540 [Trifolium subterraneum]|uniref:Aminotransferase-like plant mobile domain-containing protein n=1 Tax=Trifolium subterraneum TaxID=3900 RepID=A0A2Z6N9R8_TRISU|nr:hypothetical protein TSUD_239540 [Trifolium subterraneum]